MGDFKRGRPSRQDPPHKLGLYRFRNKDTDEIDYIGESGDIKYRIGQHLRNGDVFSGETHHVEWQAAQDGSTSLTRREHERLKIDQHKPRLNRRRGGGGRRSKR